MKVMHGVLHREQMRIKREGTPVRTGPLRGSVRSCTPVEKNTPKQAAISNPQIDELTPTTTTNIGSKNDFIYTM